MTNHSKITEISLWVIAAFALIIAYSSFNRFFDHDEFEHLHSAWYIAQGLRPYSDFYQNHNPLSWFLMKPLIQGLGDSVITIRFSRLVFLILTFGIGYFTFQIALKATGRQEIGLFSLILLFSTVIFLNKSIEIRPDVPQVLFGLISLYYLFIFLETGGKASAIISGLSLSISFLFLQKAIFLAGAYFCIFTYLIYQKKIMIREVIWFAVAVIVPLGLFLSYLVENKSLWDYVLTGWIVNAYYLNPFSPIESIVKSAIQNPAIWLGWLISLPLIFLFRGAKLEMRVVAFTSLCLLVSAFVVRQPWKQYLMGTIPLMSVCAAYVIWSTCEWLELKRHYLLLFVLTASVPSSILFLSHSIRWTNESQLEKIDYVLKNSEPNDIIHDGDIQFNIFRPDLHYFWLGISKGKDLDTYRSKTQDPKGNYNICDLIVKEKPLFASNYIVPSEFLEKCGYQKTRFHDLYVKHRKPSD